MVTSPCPSCSRPLQEEDKHCDSPSCPWLRCGCEALVDPRNGNHFEPE
jgi:hypothetical protein